MASKRKRTTSTTNTTTSGTANLRSIATNLRKTRKTTTTTSPSSSSSNPAPTTSPSPSPPDLKPIYFWRPTDPRTGFLSQWHAAHPFRSRSSSPAVYPTAEHYMMHRKAVLFGDAATASRVLGASAPRDVRALGRQVRGFDEGAWGRAREGIVREASWCKFSLSVAGGEDRGEEDGDGGGRVWKLGDGAGAGEVRGASFREALLATGDRPLVEASPFDRVWGIGFAAKDAERNRARWGLNLLGKCLMEVRQQFRMEEKKEEEEGEQKGGEDIVEGKSTEVRS